MFRRTFLVMILCTPAAWARSGGRLAVRILDAETKQPIPARVELSTAAGRPVARKSFGVLTANRQLYVDGEATWQLGVGQYRFVLDAGPEYRTQQGSFEIESFADDDKTIEMTRFANLAEEGWYAGDVTAQLSESDSAIAQRAGQLDFVMGSGPLVKTQAKAFSHRLRFSDDWELPLLVAENKVDAVLALTLPERAKKPAGYPVDRQRFTGPQALGQWREAIYFHLLNTGHRLPLVAGSDAGKCAAPLGAARVYVASLTKPSATAWWDAALAGRTVATNGPLLRPRVESHPPGYEFSLARKKSLELSIALNLALREPVEYLEILKNGQVLAVAQLAEWAKNNGKLPPVKFDRSGWFAVRAVTTNAKFYQLALTGPYWVNDGKAPFISRRSVQFFLDWIAAGTAYYKDAKRIEYAIAYWQEKLAAANAQ